jgi:hypothetical protein
MVVSVFSMNLETEFTRRGGGGTRDKSMREEYSIWFIGQPSHSGPSALIFSEVHLALGSFAGEI